MPSNELSMIDQIQKAGARMNGWPDWKKKILEELFSPKVNLNEVSQEKAPLNADTMAVK